MAAPRNSQHLTDEQVARFMKYVILRTPKCFSREKAEDWTSTVFQRLRMPPTDKSTWTQERINMPCHRKERVETFAPKAWATKCALLGGEDRIALESGNWNDGLIVDLGSEEFEGKELDPRDPSGWHVDGDVFAHYLNSSEER